MSLTSRTLPMLQLLIRRTLTLPRILPPAHRCRFTTNNNTKKPDWMVQTEIEAISASKERQLAGGASPSNVMLNKLEHEFQSERVSNAMKLEDKLRMLIQKCNKHRGDRKLFNAIRKRAMIARQELIVQREAAGMAKNSVLNADTVEATFPIPDSM